MPGHPVDESGRILPDGSWPPGREAPGRLERLRRFLNTVNRENGADHLATPAKAARWLGAEGWSVRPSDAELATLRRVRDDLAAAVPGSAAASVPAWPAVGDVHLAVRTAGDGHAGLWLVGAGSGVEGVVGDLVGIAVEAHLAGTADRLRTCAHCRWIVYDRSRNVSGRWCSMGACGQRDKMRRYRARRRAGAPLSRRRGGTAG